MKAVAPGRGPEMPSDDVRKMIAYPRLLELFWEFEAKLEELHALYLDSVVGYQFLFERLEEFQASHAAILGDVEVAKREFQDTCSIAYSNLGGRDAAPVSMSPLMKQGDLRERIRENSKNYFLLGNLCLVAAYSYWEEYLRIEIGRAFGVLPPDITDTDKIRSRAR